MLHIHLISHHAICFLSLLERKVMVALILNGQGDCHCHKEGCMGLSCKYFSSISSSYTNFGRHA
jgi:hypothetical protein